MTVTAEGYTGTYDGDAHGITVNVTIPESGCTVKYGLTEGTYDLTENPTFIKASDTPKTVYYQVTAVGYKTVTGFETVTINGADINLP